MLCGLSVGWGFEILHLESSHPEVETYTAKPGNGPGERLWGRSQEAKVGDQTGVVSWVEQGKGPAWSHEKHRKCR